MFRALRQYLWEEVAPRWKAVILSGQFVLASVAAILVGSKGEVVFKAGPKVTDVIPAILTYAAIALGFCVAGMTVALTIPDREFALRLAKKQIHQGSDTRNAYSDLLFVFSWTAFVHWVAIVLSIVAMFAFRGEGVIIGPGASYVHRCLVGAIALFTGYGLCQFLVTLITLSQVGRVYIGSLSK